MGFDPVTLTILSTLVSVAGIAATTSANMQAANYQAQVAERDRLQQLDNARRAIDRSQIEAQDQDAQTRALLGEQEAVQSASGLKLGGRSQMLTRKAARELGRRDALNVRQAGEVEAYNYRILAENSASQAAFARQTASNSLLEGFLSAGGSVLGGASGLMKPKGLTFGGMTVPSTKLNKSIYA